MHGRLRRIKTIAACGALRILGSTRRRPRHKDPASCVRLCGRLRRSGGDLRARGLVRGRRLVLSAAWAADSAHRDDPRQSPSHSKLGEFIEEHFLDARQSKRSSMRPISRRGIEQACPGRRDLGVPQPGKGRAEAMTNPNPSEPQNADRMSEQASRHTLALNPLVALRGKDLVSSAGTFFKAMIKEPQVAADKWLSFVGELTDIVSGNS